MNKVDKIIIWAVGLHIVSAGVALITSSMQTNKIIRTIKKYN